MIDVGIQENIQLTKAEINDKGTLVLSLRKAGGAKSLEEQLNAADDSDTGTQDQDYYIWPFKIDDYVKTGEELLQQAQNMKKALTHILKGYMTKDEIKWNILNGLEITDVGTQMVIQGNIDKLYKNLASQFVEMVTPFVGKAINFRVKFVRQSKDKHYSSLPRVTEYTNLSKEPFWESMNVKAEASNVAYSNYELGFRKGDKDKPSGVDLSDPTQTVTETVADPQEAADVAAIMGIEEEETTTEAQE